MTDGISKRRHIRFSAMGTVEVMAQGLVAQEGYLASICRGGVGIYLPFAVQVSQLLIVNIRLVERKEGEEDLRVAARVRWTTTAGRLFMAGLAFEQMSDARYSRLLQHLHIIEARQLGDRSSESSGHAIRFTVRE